MRKWFHRSLKNQLIIFILVVVIVPIFFLGFVSYISTVKLSQDRAEISGSRSLSQLQTSLDFIVDDVLSMSIFLIGNKDVQDYMQEDTSTPRQRSNITGFLSNLAYSKKYISNITLYPLSDNPDLSTNPRHADQGDVTFKEDENKWWIYRTYEETVSGRQETITLTRPVRSLNGFHEIGYLSISLNQHYLEELLESIDLEWSGTVLLLKNDLLLASNIGKEINEYDYGILSNKIEQTSYIHSETFKINGEKANVFSTNISDVNWSLVGIIPYKEFSFQNRYLLWLTVFTIIIATLFVIMLVWFFVSKVLDPLIVLTKSLTEAKPGEKIEQFPLTQKNEVGNLINSYNKLNDRISFLMNKVKSSESVKRQVDLQALQNQINPHFLYNTLASIHWIALRSGTKSISTMVSSLSTYLRYSLNEGNEFTTVEQEIDLLKHYNNIQRIRFPDMFDINIHVQNELKQHKILKLVIQPLIENSIVHGKSKIAHEKLIIHLTPHIQQHYICFTVVDNGVGMPKEKIGELNEQFALDEVNTVVVGKNYGLRNVNLRLMMHYGKKSRLHISNNDDKGVRIQFLIPLEKENNNESVNR